MRTRIGRRIAVGVVALTVAGTAMVAVSGATVDAGHASNAEQTGPTCSNPADQVSPTAVDQVSELIAGTWIRCDGPPLFGDGSDGEVGVDVAGDRFHRLYRAPDGTLIRAEGLDQEGTVTIFDNTSVNGPGSYQTNWKLVGQGTMIFTPTFFRSPSVMGLAGMTGASHYERWTGAAPTPGLPPGAGTAACGSPTTPMVLASVAQVQGLLVGPWTSCGTGSAIGDAAGEVGLEFTADGRFRRLVRLADGTVVRGVGDGQEGAWIVSDTTNMNGPGSYQLDLIVDGRGTFISTPVFLASPMAVRFVGQQIAADYLAGRPSDITPSTPPIPLELPPTGGDSLLILAVAAAATMLLGGAFHAAGRRHR